MDVTTVKVPLPALPRVLGTFADLSVLGCSGGGWFGEEVSARSQSSRGELGRKSGGLRLVG